MNLDYARVSTNDQDLALQSDTQATADCERIFTDTMSGTKLVFHIFGVATIRARVFSRQVGIGLIVLAVDSSMGAGSE